MNGDFQRINIAVKLPEAIFDEVIRLSSGIGQENQAYFILDGVNFIPHVTLYSPEYPNINIDRVIEEVARIARETSSFTALFTKIRSHLGYIDISLDKTEEWVDLNNQIVNALNPLREGHLREKYLDPEELNKYSSQQQEYIKKYGYSEVLGSFMPHLTLSRLKDEVKAQEVASSLDVSFKEFLITHIAAFTMGNHGTCEGIIKEWRLAP